MNEETATPPHLHRFHRFRSRELALLLVVVTSCIAYVLSEGVRFGDSITYANEIRSGGLIEPGHLLWRPLGYVIGHALGTLDTYSSALWTLQGLCLAASVIGVVAIYVLCRNVAGPGIALFVAALSAVSNGYWVYAFSGCSYTLGVLFQTLALHYAIRERQASHRCRNALAAGAFGGLAVSAWAINALASPAILLALITATADSCKRMQQSSRKAAAFALGYFTTCVLPIVLAFMLIHNAPRWRVGLRTSSSLAFAQWLSTARHDVPVHFGVTQLLRAAMGWAQSVISLSDVGYRLRLWHLGEGAFPVSLWSLVVPLFYVGVLVLAAILVRGESRLDTRSRSLIYASAFALGLNLAFGAAWQSTDLERYMPSWPFQMLLLTIALNLLWERVERVPLISLASTSAVAALVIVNWQGTFKPVLDANSYRSLWVTAIRQHASRGDVVVVFGQRKSVIVPPHDGNFPRIDNLSDEIQKGGTRWRSLEINEIRLTQSRGGRVFLADSLFWLDSAPRDGWSFKEYPMPTPREIHDAFMPFKSETIAFTVGRERVWAARMDTAQ